MPYAVGSASARFATTRPRRTATRLLALAGVLMTALACKPPAPVQRPTPRVGVLVPLSGPAASTGQALLNGIELGQSALAREQADVDNPTRFLPEDSLGTPEGALAALEYLVNEADASIIVGAIRPSVVVAVAARAAELGVTLLTPIPPDPTTDDQGAYHLRAGADHDARFLNALLASRPDLERIAVLTLDESPAVSAARALISNAIDHEGRELVRPDRPVDADVTLSLVALDRAQPDAVFLVGNLDDISVYRRPAAEFELELVAFTTDADPALFRLPTETSTDDSAATHDDASLVDGRVAVTPEPVPDTPSMAQAYRRVPSSTAARLALLVQQYENAYQTQPDAWAAYGYDLVRIADHALRHHDGTPQGITKALNATRRFPGVTGLLSFSAERQAHRVLRLVAEAGDGPPPFPVLPVWVLGSIPLPVADPLPGTNAPPAIAPSPDAADTTDEESTLTDVDDVAPADGTTTSEPVQSPADDAPLGLADAVVVIVDFAEPAGERAQALGDLLTPHVSDVIMAFPSSIASVAALATAHLYRSDRSDEAGAIAVRIAEITGLATTQHPNTSTGLDAVRRIIETYPNANYFLIVN